VANVVLLSDPPEHTRLRHVVAPLFSKRAVQAQTSDIRQLAAAAIAPLTNGDVVDMVPALTIPMPINVIATILGIPREQWAAFRALAFGRGLYFCLGAHLARLEAVTAVDCLRDEIDGLELAGPVRWGTTPSLQGPASVPLRVSRR